MLKKMQLFRFLLLLSTCSLIILRSSAQYKITGTIVDHHLKPIHAVNILLVNEKNMITGTVSNENGQFLFPSVQEGKYKLEYSHVNHEKVYNSIYVNEDITLDSIVIFPKTYVLEEVTIQADRKFLNQSIGKTVYSIPSTLKKSSIDMLQIFQHLPNVNSNLIERTLEINGRSDIMLEVNGVPKDINYISSIPVGQIKNIELITNPTGKYLSKGISGVINITTNKKEKGFFGMIGTRQTPDLVFGLTYPGFQYNWNKFSISAGGQNLFFNEEKHRSERSIITLIENLPQKTVKKSNSFPFQYLANDVNFGVDYALTTNSLIALSLHLETNKYDLNNQLKGLYYKDNRLKESSISERFNESLTNNQTYNIYYQYINPKNQNKIVAKIDLNNFKSEYTNDYKESFSEKSYRNKQVLNNNKKAYNLYLDYEIGTNRFGTLSIGSRLNYQELIFLGHYQMNSITNKFTYSVTRNISYFDVSAIKFNNISLQFGTEVDLSSIDINDSTQNSYSFFLPNVTWQFNPNTSNSLLLSFRMRRNEPTIESLNPLERYTDSLKVITGNPSLQPYYFNTFKLKYTYSKGKTFISPEIGYSLTDKYITTIGETGENGIYQVSYHNTANYRMFFASVNFGVNVFKWWRIKAGIGIMQNNFSDERIKKELFTYNYSAQNSFFYKNISAHLNIRKKADDLYSNMIYTNPVESSLYAQWKINKRISVNAGIRYFIPWDEKFVIHDHDYYEHYSKEINDRKNLFFIGANFLIFKGIQSNIKKKKFQNEKDVQMKERF